MIHKYKLWISQDEAVEHGILNGTHEFVKCEDHEKEVSELKARIAELTAVHEAELGVCQKHCDIVKELEKNQIVLIDNLKWFCNRVKNGKVLSKRTYATFKNLIAKFELPQPPNKQGE